MIKALHVKTFCCEGVMDFIHGGGRYTDSIFVPEANLLISYDGNTAYVVEGKLDEFTSDSTSQKNLKPQIIGEMEVPDALVWAARSLLLVQKGFKELVEQSWKMPPV